ncbi:MAG TPA: Maf family protein [Solirubrobacteraceae bacterium]|nr:Maf family protein [Solirubrobacteraceae bacterium]
MVLASQSPQRRAILERLGVPFTVRPVSVPELAQGDPERVARENALRKARAAWAQGAAGAEGGGVHGEESGVGGEGSGTGGKGSGAHHEGAEAVLGCDTLVALGGVIYGKPSGEDAARRTLRALGGATHEVFSGLALLAPDGDERVAIARTAVTFRALDDELLDWYVATGEWRGRAGAYAIQGAGAALVRGIEGDYENVVGLPVATLLDICPELLGA